MDERVVVCTALYPDNERRSSDGVTHAVKDLVESAKSQGMDVAYVVRLTRAFSRRGFVFPRKRCISGVVVYTVPFLGVRRFSFPAVFKAMMKVLNPSRDFDRVVYHVYSSYFFSKGMPGSRRAKKTLVLHQTDVLKKSWVSKSLGEFDRVLARSEPIKKEFEKVVDIEGVVFSGIEESVYRFNDNHCFNDGVRIVFVGQLIRRKNLLEVIRAVSIIRKSGVLVSLDVYGDGPDRALAEKLISDAGISDVVNLHGFSGRDTVLDSMYKSDIMLMPSVNETFGLVYLEAMSQGCVVVGHKGTGVDGIVEDRVNGYLVESSSPEEIANKVFSYLSLSRDEKHEMRKVSYMTAKNFSAKEMGRNYFKLCCDE